MNGSPLAPAASQPRLAPASLEPIPCDQARLTTIAASPRRGPGGENYHFSVDHDGQPPILVIGGPLEVNAGQWKYIPGLGRYRIARPTKDENTLNVSVVGPNHNNFDQAEHPTVKLELGPNLVLDNGGTGYSGQITYPEGLHLGFHHIQGAACPAAGQTAPTAPAKPTPPPAPIPTPAPPASSNAGPAVRILWADKSNQDIVGQKNNLVPGEPVHLLQGCAPGPDGTPLTQFAWGIPKSLTGGFEVTANGGHLRDAVTDGPAITLYAAFAGNHPPVRLTCTDAKGRANSAQTNFDVIGPGLEIANVQARPGQLPLVKLDAEIGTVEIHTSTDDVFDDQCVKRTVIGIYMGLRTERHNIVYSETTHGVVLKAKVEGALPHNGRLEWVQLVTEDTVGSTSKSNMSSTKNNGTGLDGGYPYPGGGGTTLQDSPQTRLQSEFFQHEQRTFSARSYLMFTSGAAGSTAVPIAVVEWGYEAAAHVDPTAKGSFFWTLETASKPPHITQPKPAFSIQDFPAWKSRNNASLCPQ